MRLKRLETYGFKSFADRMSFDFDQGITAIIGPNGCGKSNIVDSIKWVVGEQSAKALRGADMSDVIFNGCATRRPMPLAEVTLVLERDDDAIDGGELALTRRLTRDGQSSYYLNGKPARLRDIREVLMGTGMGTSAYSVIEQGRIGFILEASTKDRRAILEEAAGISRYKARRKVAARKLDRVDTDLERIGQIAGEVEKRLRTVRRQAAAALRYQELDGKLRDMRMVFALEEFGRLSGEREKETAPSATCKIRKPASPRAVASWKPASPPTTRVWSSSKPLARPRAGPRRGPFGARCGREPHGRCPPPPGRNRSPGGRRSKALSCPRRASRCGQNRARADPRNG